MKSLQYILSTGVLILVLSACGSSDSETTDPITPDLNKKPEVTQGACDIKSAKEVFSLSAPTKDAIVFHNQKFIVSFTDGNNSFPKDISKVEYWADNKTLFLGSSTTYPYSIDIDSSVLSNGEHEIQAFARDSCDNEVSSQKNTVLSYAQSFKDANEYHVSVNGSADGNGSIASPWDITTAFGTLVGGDPVYTVDIQPGDIIWIHGGDYNGVNENIVHKSHLTGTKDKPILIRAYGDGAANLHVTGQSQFLGRELSTYNWFWGLEPHINRLEREISEKYHRLSGISVHRAGQRVINCIISNNGHPGIATWVGVGGDGDVYGNLVWGNGVYDVLDGKAWARGSGLYGQTNEGNRQFKDNVFFRNFTNGFKLYGQQGTVNGAIVDGTIAFKTFLSPILLTTTNIPMQNLSVTNNYTYAEEDEGRTGVELGGGRPINDTLLLKGHYFVGGKSPVGAVLVSTFNNATISDNTIITRATKDDAIQPRLFSYVPTPNQINMNWDNNKYYGGRDRSLNDDNIINNYTADKVPKYFYHEDQWLKEYPFDISSIFSRSYPTENKIVVRPNHYERGRGHIVIYNWKELQEVEVNIASLGLDEGEKYEVRDIQNYYDTPIIQATYHVNEPILKLPMDLVKVSKVLGDTPHMDEYLSKHTSIRFATFIVLKI